MACVYPSEDSAYLALTPAAARFLFGLAGEKKQLVPMTLLMRTYRCCSHCTKCDSRSAYDERLGNENTDDTCTVKDVNSYRLLFSHPVFFI